MLDTYDALISISFLTLLKKKQIIHTYASKCNYSIKNHEWNLPELAKPFSNHALIMTMILDSNRI